MTSKKKYKYNLDSLQIFLDKKGLIRLKDKIYLKKYYRIKMNSEVNLENPQTFNEKLQWLKLYDRNPEYTKMVDKYEAKKLVSDILGEEYIVPTLGIWNRFEDIDFKKLPQQFVLKCTHDSGGVVICKDKSKFDVKNARKKLKKSLKRNYYYSGREWPYKNVRPRIIAEQYMKDDRTKDIRDFKFFCFNGIPRIMYISDRSHTEDQRICFFDMDYKKIDIQRTDYKEFDAIPEKPYNFEKMKELSKKLSKNIPHIRVDWYEINGKLYFSELTFYTGSGYIPFKKEIYDKKLGDMINLPQ